MNARWLLAVALFPLPAAADDAAEKAKAKDLAAFQGDWRVDWVERDGEKLDLGADAVYTIKGNKWLLGDREISSIQIDPGYDPKLLDLTRLIGDERKGFKMEGIYKIKGDTMVWCCYTGEGAKQRPQEFRAERGWDGSVYHMTRVKRTKDSTTPPLWPGLRTGLPAPTEGLPSSLGWETFGPETVARSADRATTAEGMARATQVTGSAVQGRR